MKMHRRIVIPLLIVSAVLWGLALASLNIHAPLVTSVSAEDLQAKSVSPQDDIPDALALISPGFPRDLASGDAVPLYGDVMAQLHLAKGEKRFYRTLDLRLFHKISSQDIDDATVQVMGKMLYMNHGDFVSAPVQPVGGRYILQLPFPMPGEWRVDIVIEIAGKQTKMQLEIDLYE